MAADERFASPKQLLDARHLRPRKRFGQNFLTDPRLAERIARSLPADACVLEIGGGTGTLTAALAEVARLLTVLEIDRDLSAILSERFAAYADRVRIVTADVLQFDIAAALGPYTPPRAICGNLPYYITTPIIERLFEAADVWECAVLMVQREYARRLVAHAGTPAYGSLTLFCSYFADIEKLFDVGAAGFYPAPDVASTVVRLTPVPARRELVRDEGALLWLVRAAFRHRRKTLVNSLLEGVPQESGDLRARIERVLLGLGLTPKVRAERLKLADFCALADTLTEQGLMERLWIARPIATP